MNRSKLETKSQTKFINFFALLYSDWFPHEHEEIGNKSHNKLIKLIAHDTAIKKSVMGCILMGP